MLVGIKSSVSGFGSNRTPHVPEVVGEVVEGHARVAPLDDQPPELRLDLHRSGAAGEAPAAAGRREPHRRQAEADAHADAHRRGENTAAVLHRRRRLTRRALEQRHATRRRVQERFRRLQGQALAVAAEQSWWGRALVFIGENGEQSRARFRQVYGRPRQVGVTARRRGPLGLGVGAADFLPRGLGGNGEIAGGGLTRGVPNRRSVLLTLFEKKYAAYTYM